MLVTQGHNQSRIYLANKHGRRHIFTSAMARHWKDIGVGDGGRGILPPPPKKKIGQITCKILAFLSIFHTCIFWQNVLFPMSTELLHSVIMVIFYADLSHDDSAIRYTVSPQICVTEYHTETRSTNP